jgi:hypothetical protein
MPYDINASLSEITQFRALPNFPVSHLAGWMQGSVSPHLRQAVPCLYNAHNTGPPKIDRLY